MVSRRLLALVGTVALLAASAVRAAEPADAENAFRMRFVMSLDTTMPGGKSLNVTGDTEIRYAWKVHGNERTLRYDQMRVLVKGDGAERANVVMNRSKIVT